MRRVQPEFTLSLDRKHRKELWSFWKYRNWVEGEFDGTLSWQEVSGPPTFLLQDLFFGLPINETHYDIMVKGGWIPPKILHFPNTTQVETIKLPKVEPKVKVVLVGKRKKRLVSSTGKVRGTCHLMKAWNKSRLEVGRGTKEGDKWVVVGYQGLKEVSRETYYTQQDASIRLKMMKGVVKVKKIYH